MFEQWIPLQRYKLIRPSDEEANANGEMPPPRWQDWFALRRVRTGLAIGALILVVLSLSHFVDLPPRGGLDSDTGAPSQPPSGSTPAIPVKPADGVQWSDFAYVQYITNANYLCNSLMIMEALQRSGTKADRIMMYPRDWKISESADASTESKLLVQARDQYGAKLVPIEVQTFSKGDATWKDSYTKLLAFNQTQYKRVMSLDSDATVRKHMDELFLLPSSPVAMPRAYWLDQPFLSSQLVLVEPSDVEWHRVQEFMNTPDSGFDMDILNTMYKDSCIIIPHKNYNLLSGEFRGDKHEKYLGSDKETWDGAKVLDEAKFVHFSDWPVPKPWLKASDSIMDKHQPKCKEGTNGGAEDCTDRDIWRGLYKDFSDRRQRICGRSYDKRHEPRSEKSLLAPPKYEMVLP